MATPRDPALDSIPILGYALRPFQQFAQAGTLGGIMLLVSTAIALVWANSGAAESYFQLWETPMAIGLADRPLTLSLHAWINDALMAVFFLLVGLEIKRELLVGELASPRQAALPIAAAVGGMIVPAGLYAALNIGGPGAPGWGIPMATDIAFALGVLTMLGSRVPIGLKVFLAALAIVDDMGAVLVIALFYTSALNLAALGVAAAAIVVLMALNRRGITALGAYLTIGVVLWIAVHESGIHATIAGVLLALTIPAKPPLLADTFSERARALLDEFDAHETGDQLVLTSKGQQEAIHAIDSLSNDVQTPLLRLEHGLHNPVAFFVMPIFALANAGVSLGGSGGVIGSPIALGVMAGLVLGKPIGITLFSWLAVRTGMASLPANVGWRGIHGAAWLGGIGFTMSLFIAGLAFTTQPSLEAAKIGILLASTIAGIVGSLLLILRGASAPVRIGGDEPTNPGTAVATTMPDEGPAST